MKGLRPSPAELSVPERHFCFSACRAAPGPKEKSPMTIETAVFVFAAGSILVAVLIWQTHRLTSRRLGKIQNDLDMLQQEFHWLFLKDLNRKSEETAASELVEKITPRRRDR
jgi:hypothetical protein